MGKARVVLESFARSHLVAQDSNREHGIAACTFIANDARELSNVSWLEMLRPHASSPDDYTIWVQVMKT